MRPNPTEKVCTRCDGLKALADFRAITKRGKPTHRSYCLNCERQMVREWMRAKKRADPLFAQRQREATARLLASEKFRAHRRDAQRSRYATDPSFVARQKAASQAHYRSNTELYRAKRQRSRAIRAGAPGFCSPQQLAARMDFYGRRCVYCGGPFEHVDHVIPLSRGGSNWPANLRPSCARCNLSKHTRERPYATP